MTAEVAVGIAKRRPLAVAKVIDSISCARLRDTRAPATAKGQDRVERVCWQRVSQRESRVGRIVKVGVELPKVYRV